MSRRVPLLAMLAVLLGLLVSPASAATEGILLRGNRTGYVDLYVYVNRTIAVGDIDMQTKGTFVGFFLSPAPANRDTVGALVMPKVGANGGDSAGTIKLGQSYDVRAGKYRAFLITDGPAEVFIPIEGQGFRGWTANRAAPLSLRSTGFDVQAGSSGGAMDVPVPLRTRSLIVAAGVASSGSLTAVEQLSACVRDGDTCTSTRVVSARLPLATVWAYGSYLAMPGYYSARFDIERTGGYDAGSRVDGTVMILTIGRQS